MHWKGSWWLYQDAFFEQPKTSTYYSLFHFGFIQSFKASQFLILEFFYASKCGEDVFPWIALDSFFLESSVFASSTAIRGEANPERGRYKARWRRIDGRGCNTWMPDMSKRRTYSNMNCLEIERTLRRVWDWDEGNTRTSRRSKYSLTSSTNCSDLSSPWGRLSPGASVWGRVSSEIEDAANAKRRVIS